MIPMQEPDPRLPDDRRPSGDRRLSLGHHAGALACIGGLLHGKGEFERRPQKRYDDTSLLESEILEHGFDRAHSLVRAFRPGPCGQAGQRVAGAAAPDPPLPAPRLTAMPGSAKSKH